MSCENDKFSSQAFTKILLPAEVEKEPLLNMHESKMF